MQPQTESHHKTNMALPAGLSASVAALYFGFGDCAFNPDTVGACADTASGMVSRFQEVGLHFINWGVTLLREIF